ncbi:prepilin-type N-terminal cleavage/methylation domain-containing protein [Acinetobacter rudis]|uniref:prepilin-type N-terminal cleavage/methylation domain-containing protein n=1 Tax=Acinetobacter rudis TaxID=632955 RepID=UPI00280CDFA3|nr:prepilin-type N-terminal cleavage/methylation domain-containing protein [Acinetobacter rudis]MDQ8952304.1 prepilin-type N-terminal cleavage/methylation domain-containing protein [Acinetobacter rudis]
MDHLNKQQTGFTLVEVMVVIVIMGILMSLVMLNIEGMDMRKVMQQRELLILDLKKINREANDQASVYALSIQPETDVHPFQYRVMTYYKPQVAAELPTMSVTQQNPWQELKQFPVRELPAKVSFRVISQEQNYAQANNTDLLGEHSPQLIWFGNGEAKPVQIQMYYSNKEIGAPILIDYLGKVDATP